MPTAQQVEQWIKDVDTAFMYAQVLEDSVTRTHWAMGTIQYKTHRELIQQRINEGVIASWEQLKHEERKLVQDPVLTKYDNYWRFFNFEWRSDDTVNSFLLHLGKKESLLPHSFFKIDDDEDDHELKIAFVWSKIPEAFRREIMRNGVLLTTHIWPEFERALPQRGDSNPLNHRTDGRPRSTRWRREPR